MAEFAGVRAIVTGGASGIGLATANPPSECAADVAEWLRVAEEAMAAAKRHGLTVSYDPNYRPSLWQGSGGWKQARETDLRLAAHADVIVGALGLAGGGPEGPRVDPADVPEAFTEIAGLLPNVRVLATTLRTVVSAGVNDWSSAAWSRESGYVRGPEMPGLHVLDRIGSGDGFATGLIYGLISGVGLARALAYGTVHGALAMTTPGDTSMASLADVEALIETASSSVRR